ncbi:defensin-like protein [Capsicum galapagoense]
MSTQFLHFNIHIQNIFLHIFFNHKQMAKLSSTLCLFLLLVFVAGSSGARDTAGSINANEIVPNDQCLTNLGVCSDKLCGEQCCEKNCFDNFKEKNPSGACETIPGSALRLCNCHHDC